MIFQNWIEVSNETKDFLQSQARVLNYKRGESIYRQGDSPKGLYFVDNGLVGFTITAAASGKEHLLRFFKQGQFFGHRSLFSEETYHGTAVALEATRVSFVPKEFVLIAVKKDSQLLVEVVRTLSKELRSSETQRVMILENEILPRVAASLVYLKDLQPEHLWTRQEIANYCASTVSTVIKAMAELENRKMISQIGRSIEILNRDALIALAEDF